ncbi:MAG: hypothetical protein M3400_12705, partial [Actinomycetota bacterium]|nr:hypothetical protein [Actinomycetota bacterium]
CGQASATSMPTESSTSTAEPATTQPTTTEPTTTRSPTSRPTSTETTATDTCAASSEPPTPTTTPSQQSTESGLEAQSAGTGAPPVVHRPPVGSSRPTPPASSERETRPGSYDGAEAPVFGVLDGLDLSPRGDDSDILREVFLQTADSVSISEPTPDVLSTPVLLALLFLTVVGSGLVRTSLTARRVKKLGSAAST